MCIAISKISFSFLLFERSPKIAIAYASLPFGGPRFNVFGQERRDIARFGLDRSCYRPAAERSESDFPSFQLVSRQEAHAGLIIDDNDVRATHDHGAPRSEI